MNSTLKTILTVDDDTIVNDKLKSYLEGHNYDVVSTKNAAECLSVLQDDNELADVILMDIQLSDRDGLALITEIRELTSAPILVVSNKDETATKVIGLELGADDFIEKPFDHQELLARIKAAVRRYQAVPADKEENLAEEIREDIDAEANQSGISDVKEGLVYSFNGWVFDPRAFTLSSPAGDEIELTTAEFELLKVFVKAPRIVLSREKLFDLLKEEDYDSYDRAIDIRISRLRKKLKDDPKSSGLIKTVHGSGYMFNADVEQKERTA